MPDVQLMAGGEPRPWRFRVVPRRGLPWASILALLLGALLLASCGEDSKKKSGKSGGASTPSAPAACTSSLAWCAPVGDAVQGATLYDGWEDLRIVPAPVNVTGGWTDSVAVTADGLHLYFGYTKYDVSDFFIYLGGGGGTLFNPTGPTRDGMIGDKFQIFRADLSTSGWSVHYHEVNSTDPTVTQASASMNEAQDLMVFSRFDPDSSNATLWYSQLVMDAWTTPARLPMVGDSAPPILINADCAGGGDDNGFVIGSLDSTVTLYWESRRAVTDGSNCRPSDEDPKIHHLYQATFNGTWSTITPVPGLNDFTGGDESDDTQISLSPDGLTAYWTSIRTYNSAPFYGLLTADWDGNVFTDVRPVITPTYVQTPGKLHLTGELNVAETTEGWVGYLMCGIVNSSTLNDIDLSVCRMRKPAPATINTAMGWSDSPFISRDGQRLYFMYSRYNFAPWILGGPLSSIVASGPDRPGLHKATGNPFDESDIYVSTKQDDGSWGTPVNLGLNSAWGDSSGMEINNGDTFIWLQGNGSTNNIVVANKNPDGTWGAPVALDGGVNDPAAIEDNPHLSADGQIVWFVSDRAGGQGGKDIWYSTWNGTGWNTPINQGINVNSSGDEDQPFISAVSTDVYWNSPSGLMHCLSNGSDCIPATIGPVDIPGCRIADAKLAAEASLPDSGSPLYFACGDAATGRVSIMYAEKQPDDSWSPATPVD